MTIMDKNQSSTELVKQLVQKLQQKGVKASLCKRPTLNFAMNAK
jgi:hypothetical protein